MKKLNKNKFFAEKWIWITGATSGIGAALALELNALGAKLVLSGRNEDLLLQVKKKCNEALIVPFDLKNPEEITQAANLVLEQVPTLSMLVSNAGISQRSLALETDPTVSRTLMEVNYFAPVQLTRLVVPHFLERGQGHLVYTSSLMGLFATPLRSSYCASKHALEGYVNSLRMELRDSPICVTTIQPGFINTNISKRALKGDGRENQSAIKDEKRTMSPEECSREIITAIMQNKPKAKIGGFEIYGDLLHRFIPQVFDQVITKVKVTR